MNPIDLVTDKLEGNGTQFKCPAHDDSVASLTVTESDDGAVLVHCHAGCSTKLILDSIGVSPNELFPERVDNEPKTRQKAEVVATYDYTDEQDHRLYQVRRYHPKRFSQHRWNEDTGSWEARLGEDVRRVPYHLRSLVGADPERWIFVVEGEKDVETLEAQNLVATTTAGGAGGWNPGLSVHFANRRVAILPDNDDPGRDYARGIACDVQGVASEVRIVGLPGVPKKGDVTDYFARGGTREELIALVRASEPFVDVPRGGEVQRGPLLVTRAESVTPSETEWFWPGRIPFGKISIIDGNPGQGKSTMTLDLVARASRGGPMPDYDPGVDGQSLVSILLSAEDGMEDTIVPRLIVAGADLSKVLAIDAVKAGDGPERSWQLPGDLDYLRDLIVETGARIVVIDPLMAYLEAGVSSNNDQHVRRALHPLKMLADETGVAMIIVRHLRKNNEGIAMLQGGGSVGIIGAARAGLVVGGDPNDPESKQRVVAVSKMNLGEPAGALAFHLENSLNGAGRIVWDGPSPHTAETLLQPAPVADLEEVGRCSDWLKKFLDSPQPVPEILQRARQMGWSDKILSRARRILGVVDLYKADGRVDWSLPMGTPSAGRN